MRILIVEDDRDISGFLKTSLEAELFSVDLAEDGEQGSMLARTSNYDVIILDNLLPKKNGMQVCREIRNKGKSVRIIIVSVEDSANAKVELLNSGADDYITKPFCFVELLARVRAVLRRPDNICSEILSVADLNLDILNYRVSRGRKNIYLTRKEFELLEYLMRNQGRVLSRGMIMDHVWDNNLDSFSNTLETHILNLRRKIDRNNKQKLIHTVPGRGYRLDAIAEVLV